MKQKFKRSILCRTIFSIIFILTFIFIIPLDSVALADDSTTRSVVGDYFNKVFSIELNDGSNLIESIESTASKREAINNQIYNKKINKNYSLYDRFGGNVKFIPYFGEVKISTGLIDRFYTKFEDNDDKFKLSADDIKTLFATPAISNNVIYENRPNILSSEGIAAGNIDPRVSAYNGFTSTGGNAALGNSMLSISNLVITVIGWLSGNNVYTAINGIWGKIADPIQKNVLNHLIYMFLPIAIYVFLFDVVKSGIKVIKGTFNIKSFLERFLGSCLSLGFVLTIMLNPMFFSTNLVKIVSIIDTSMDATMTINADEVITSDNTDNIRVATLWEKTVFEPWCNGMFGENYNKLYTTYDTNPKHIKMVQSHEDVKASWTDNKVKYNSAALTGDVKIQIGEKNFVQNWAALAWSTQSIYHIDAVPAAEAKKDDTVTKAVDAKTKVVKSVVWPKATTTPMNDKIFVDNFRWIDAKLDISPQYYSTENVAMNYNNSHKYKENFVGEGINSIYMTLLMIPIGILVFRKLANSLKIITCGYVMCYQSVMNLMMPNKYSILNNITNLLKLLYDFLWWSIIVFLAITTYSSIAGHGIIGDFIWLIIGVYLCKVKPIRTPRQLGVFINNMKNKSKRTANSILNKIEARKGKL